jgi:hypothetical protein
VKKCSFFYRESMDYLVRISWVAPYLLIPPLLAFLIYLEGFLGQKGLGAFYAPEARFSLSLWNAALLLALITGIKTCLFFSRHLSRRWFRNALSLPVGKGSGYWGPLLAVLTISSAAYALTIAAILAALPSDTGFPWAAAILNSYVPLLWAVCFGAFLGTVTSGGAAAYMFTAVMAVSLLVGFHMDGGGALLGIIVRIMPPLGLGMARNLSSPGDLAFSSMLVIHSAMSLLAGVLVYSIRLRRS